MVMDYRDLDERMEGRTWMEGWILSFPTFQSIKMTTVYHRHHRLDDHLHHASDSYDLPVLPDAFL